MKRVRSVAGIEFATAESDLAERAQTLEFGCLVHEPSQERFFPGIPGKLRPVWP